jgi:hypothetical protein
MACAEMFASDYGIPWAGGIGTFLTRNEQQVIFKIEFCMN